MCKYVLKHTDQLSNKYGQLDAIDQERRLIEYETQILIELYTIQFYKDSIDESNVSYSTIEWYNFYRYWINYDSSALRQMQRVWNRFSKRRWLTSKLLFWIAIIDTFPYFRFATQIPEHIVRLFEELSVRVPCDLIDYSNVIDDEQTNADLQFFQTEPKPLSTKHLEAIEKVLKETSVYVGNDDNNRQRRSNRSDRQTSNNQQKSMFYIVE